MKIIYFWFFNLAKYLRSLLISTSFHSPEQYGKLSTRLWIFYILFNQAGKWHNELTQELAVNFKYWELLMLSLKRTISFLLRILSGDVLNLHERIRLFCNAKWTCIFIKIKLPLTTNNLQLHKRFFFIHIFKTLLILFATFHIIFN